MSKKLTNEEILRRLKQWQTGKLKVKTVVEGKETTVPYYVHVLTCSGGGGECSADLEPKILEGEVVLICPNCKRGQQDIPQTVLDNRPDIKSFFQGK